MRDVGWSPSIYTIADLCLGLIYHIAKRGEYVEFGLPHHCHGGEKYRVSRNGKTRVLINVD